MDKTMQVTMLNLIKDMNLEVLVDGDPNIVIDKSDLNRPGLQISGFYNYFTKERIQVIGMTEWSYIDAMQEGIRKKRLMKFFSFNTPCSILTTGLTPQKELIKAASEYKRWLLRTDLVSTKFTSKITNYLTDKLANETRVHGVLVDVYGIGVLITGESGIGKSETALELIKRGHRLVADDAVDIRDADGTLIGSSPVITNGMIEVRGMGIINVTALYGFSSLLDRKAIDIIVNFEQWNDEANYDRLGVDKKYVYILNEPIRQLTLPVRPGRNMAVIVEAAAANYRYTLTTNETSEKIIDMRIEMMKNNE